MAIVQYKRIDKLFSNVLKYKKLYPFAQFTGKVVIIENIWINLYSLISNYGDVWEINSINLSVNEAYKDYLVYWYTIEYKLNNNIDLLNCKCKKCLFNFFSLFGKKCPKCGNLKIEILKQFVKRKIHGKIMYMGIKEWQLCNIEE